MADLYNMSLLQNATRIEDLMLVANNASNQLFIGGFLIAFFFLIVMTLMVKFKIEDAIMSSSFVCFILALFLRQAGYINFIYVIGFLVLGALAYFIKTLENK